jgi:hypothetical protein
MKKTLVFTSIFFLFLFLSAICQGSFNVNPLELSITMQDELIQGNTLKSIRITNTGDSDINISWYLDNPSLDLMRPNKTFISNLNWIDLEPEWQLLSPGDGEDFFVYLNIPEDETNANQSWEIWVTFKESEKQFINIEQAVRLYIDTPDEITTAPDDDSDDSPLDIVVFIIALIIVGFIVNKKKKSR